MFTNYIKSALRSIRKNLLFSVINIAGLAIGMAACLLILQYVSFELSFDQFNTNASDIYRVVNDRYQEGKLVQHGTITYSGVSKAMHEDYPEVVNYTRVEPFENQIISYNNKKIGEQNALYVEQSFLSMFSYPLLAGNAKTALLEPHTAVLTQASAKKLFGMKDDSWDAVIGKTFLIGTSTDPFKVTGICRDAPQNSHLQFDLLTSYVTLYTGANSWEAADYNFTESDFWHYVQLKKGTDYKTLEAKLSAFSQKYFQGNKVSGSDEKFYLQPLSKAHLYSDFEYEIGKTANAIVVWGLLLIAVLIIVIAWVNYINLATAKSMERAKEVGVRKVSGATKQQLIKQFLTESFLINLLALLISLLIILLVQNGFNDLVQHQLSLSYLFQKGLNGVNVAAALMAILFCGILASGFYPAFVLSSFKPILVLKGKFVTSTKGIVLRKVLVVGQFAITVALIIGSFVVYKQIQYVSSQNLGMNISQVLVVKPPELTGWDSTFINKENSFTEQLKRLPHVYGAATSWNVAGGETGRTFNVRRADQDGQTKYTMRHNSISIGYIDLYKIKIIAGRDFTYTDFNSDFGKLRNTIVNESAAKLLGFASPQEAIGKTIISGQKKWDIVGVIADYHQKSLRYAVEPTLLRPAYSTNSSISVKVDTKDLPSTLTAIKQTFNAFFPGNLFDYYFLDEHFNAQYSNDQLFGKVFAVFSGFAILLPVLAYLGCRFLPLHSVPKRLVYVKCWAPLCPILLCCSQKILSSLL